MGRSLGSAALHLERSLSWTGHLIEAESTAALEEVKRIGEKLEKGADWTDSE